MELRAIAISAQKADCQDTVADIERTVIRRCRCWGEDCGTVLVMHLQNELEFEQFSGYYVWYFFVDE